MRLFVLSLLSVLGGFPFGWYVVKATCAMPWLRFSVVCGHNAYVWLLLTIPAAVAFIWFVLSKLVPTRHNEAR
jgi:hypothetical protein